jgi:threonine synthase
MDINPKSKMYYSTRNKNLKVSLQEAVIKGLAPDGGLFMPTKLNRLEDQFFKDIQNYSFKEIAFKVASAFLGDELPANELDKIVSHTIQFDAPLVDIEKSIYSLELFHGPTLAFKDFGGRFLSGLLGFYSQQINREINILVATSGDTGSAVANGFLGVEGTRVVVLYPSGKVSDIQEKQFTTLGKNVVAIEVSGTFDDCQRLVKTAFADAELNKELFLTSANSINIGRLVPQMFYYFYAFAQLEQPESVVFSVPSGNYGNITAGLIAKKMGLPIQKFIASTNVNDIVPHYLDVGKFEPRPSVQTISNAMDVGNPSNFERLLDLYDQQLSGMRKDILGFAFTDEETHEAMKRVFNEYGYILDPHGAVGYLGLKKFLKDHPNDIGIFLETAHPAKFKEVVDDTLKTSVIIPNRLQKFLEKRKQSIRMDSSFESLKEVLMKYSSN